MFAETSSKLFFLFSETADIQPNLVGWCQRSKFEPGDFEKSVVGSNKLGAPKDSTVLYRKSPPTAYMYMVDSILAPTL